MSLNVPQFARFVVGPTLKHMGLDSLAARRLVVGTMLAESLGQFLDQVTRPGDVTIGPAFGLYQIEAATFRDLRNNYLHYQPTLTARLQALEAEAPEPLLQLVTNLAYATAICRLIYYRRPEALPAADDLDAIATYWKRFYNTVLGTGTIAGFRDKAGAIMNLTLE